MENKVLFSIIWPRIKYYSFPRISRFKISEKTEYNFLNKTLRYQKKKCIITDLKPEYKFAIDKLQIKQQFCTFHLEQLINREIQYYIKKISLIKTI